MAASALGPRRRPEATGGRSDPRRPPDRRPHTLKSTSEIYLIAYHQPHTFAHTPPAMEARPHRVVEIKIARPRTRGYDALQRHQKEAGDT